MPTLQLCEMLNMWTPHRRRLTPPLTHGTCALQERSHWPVLPGCPPLSTASGVIHRWAKLRKNKCSICGSMSPSFTANEVSCSNFHSQPHRTWVVNGIISALENMGCWAMDVGLTLCTFCLRNLKRSLEDQHPLLHRQKMDGLMLCAWMRIRVFAHSKVQSDN